MQDQILRLAKDLIEIESTTDKRANLVAVLERAKKELGGFTIEEFEKEGHPSLLVYTDQTRPKKFKIILNAHLDVVPAKPKDFKPEEKSGQLFGRGSIDMKAAAAAEILVFKELARDLNYPLALQLVTDEETSGKYGTKYQIEKGVRGEFIIAGEHTNFGINNKAKGVLWIKIICQGQTGHAAYPWLSQNAILNLNNFLVQLFNLYPTPANESWKTTINLAKVETPNQTFNKVPDECTAWLDIRFIPEDKKTILENIKKMLPKNFKLDILANEPEHIVNESDKYIKILGQSIKKMTGKKAETIAKHGASDVRFYNAVGNNGVTFGPIGGGLHSDNEWLDIKSLEKYYLILKSFLTSIN